MEERAVEKTAPLVVAWVKHHYRPAESTAKFLLLTRRQ
jgi:hypothetical protein